MAGCDAVVVGSGPNGLAAAVTLARAGLQVQVLEAQPTIGGGARTVRHQGADGPRHDLCSAVHPFAAASPFFRAFDLPNRGVRFVTPAVSYAHVLPDRPAAIAYHDLERTADELGVDGQRWRNLFEPLTSLHRTVLDAVLAGRPPHPRIVRTLGSLTRLLQQATPAWNLGWRTAEAPALLTGVAAHAGSRLPGWVGAGTLALLGTAGHAEGWPIPLGGSGVITAALAEDLRRHHGTIATGRHVAVPGDLPAARAYLFDTHPAVVDQILGRPVAPRLRRQADTGVGIAKVDFELSGPVPWSDPRVAEASTIHLGGDRSDLVDREYAVASGRPGVGFILASDPNPFDPSRADDDRRPLWSYAHVAYGSGEDVGAAVQTELERAAPGLSDLVVSRRTIPAAELSNHNANFRGGDITVGMHALPDFLFGTNRRLRPYGTAREDVFLCSAATPPGPGVHGMCGFRAAAAVLRRRFGRCRRPDLQP